MIKAFALTFKLGITYRVNSLLFNLGRLPLLGKHLPTRLYDSGTLKTLKLVLAILSEIVDFFLGKIIYLGIFIALAALEIRPQESVGFGAYFLHVFFFLSLIGSFFNNGLWESNANSHYAVFLMRMDAKRYALSNYIFFLLKTFLGFVGTLALLYGIAGKIMDLSDVDPLWILLLPLFVTCLKIVLAGVNIWLFKRKKKIFDVKHFPKTTLSLTALCLAAAYLLPLADIVLPLTVFYASLAFLVVAAVPALICIFRGKDYRKIYQSDPYSPTLAADLQKSVQDNYKEKLVMEADDGSKKKGCAYLNEIFVRRHRKVLIRPVLWVTGIIGVLLMAALAACLVNQEIAAAINERIMAIMPLFLLLLYFINRGETTTRIFFYSCDCYLLPYRCYRQPKVILDLFWARMKTIVRHNLIPASLLALGLPLLLYISGGTEQPLDYPVLFFSILAMSVFFSVHHLVLYYLLQPYTAGLEMKSTSYTMITLVTYWACYILATTVRKTVDPLIIGIVFIAFCLLYVAIALLLAYRRAPKTFKLR